MTDQWNTADRSILNGVEQTTEQEYARMTPAQRVAARKAGKLQRILTTPTQERGSHPQHSAG